MLRRSARLKQKKQDEQLKWERWFAVQRWAKKREKTPPHAYLDLPCPDSELLFATNSPRQPDNAHHVLEKSIMERSAKYSDELHENMLSQSKIRFGNSAHMGTAFQMSDHGKLLSPMDRLKQKSPLPGAGSTTVSTLQHEKNLLGNSDLTHKKQPSPKKLLENGCSEGKRTPHPAGLFRSSPVGQSPRSNPAGNRTPVVLVQKLPKFCQLGSPVSVSSLSRMNSPAESLGRADLPMISSFDKSCRDDGSVRNFLCSEVYSSTCIDYHGCHASETSDGGMQGKTDTTQTYSSTSSLVLTSLELAANEGIDDQCFNTMLETCAQMTKVCQTDDRVSVEKSPQDVQDRHISHLQTVGEPWSSADIMDLSGQHATEASVKNLLSQNQTCSVTESASLGSFQGTVDSSVRKESAVSEACRASYKNMGTGKKVEGREKRCLPQDAPSVKSTVYGSGKPSLEYGVTGMEARKGLVKMLMKEKVMLEDNKTKGYMYKCRYCSFCTKYKKVKQQHVRNCHPLNCRSCHRQFSDSEIFKSHKAVCDRESYSRCSLCVRTFLKKHTKRHFHSQSHQRIVLLLKKAALHIQHHGNIYGLLSSITCDVSSGCETCHSTSVNMEEPEDDGFAENRTAALADTSLHSDLQQTSTSTSLPECPQSQGAAFLAEASVDNSQRHPASSLHQLSLQGQERAGDPEAEPIADCSDSSVVCEGTLVSSASETAGSQVIAADCVGCDFSRSGQQHSVSALDSQRTSTRNLDNNPSLVRVTKSNVEVLTMTNPTPAQCSSTAVSRPVLRSVGPGTQKGGDNTFIDLIDFLDEYDLSAVEMEDDSGVDLEVLTAGNCSDSSLVQCGQSLTQQRPDQSAVCSSSCQDLCDGVDKGVPDDDEGAATDATVLADQEMHWPHTVQSSAPPYITARDPISEENGRTFPNVPCPTYGYSDVSADCSQDTDVSAVEHLQADSVSGCKTVDSADCVVGDVPEDSSTQHEGNRNGVWPSECSYLSESSFPGIISSVTVPEVTGLQEQTQAQDHAANQSPAEQPAVESRFVVNLAAMKPKPVPHTADNTPQESDSAGTSALPVASLTGPPWREASVVPRVEDWIKGSAAASSNTTTFVVDLRCFEMPESSVPKSTDDTTPAATRSISVPPNPAERASVDSLSRNTSVHAAENDSQHRPNQNSQQRPAAERQMGNVACVGRPRKRGRKGKTSPLSPKRPKLAQTTTCPEAGVSVEKWGKVTLPAVWQTADTEAPTVSTGSEHTRPGFGATAATKEAKINSSKGKQISVTQQVSEHGTVSTSTSKQRVVSTSTSKPSVASTSTSKPSVASTSTSKPSVASTSTSKPSVASTSTSKPSVASTSTSKPSVASTSTSKPSVASTSTSKQSTVSTSTSKQSVVSTSTSKPSVVSASTPKQRVVSTSTSKQPVASTSKQPAVSTSTSKQQAVSTSKSKQPVVSTSTSKQPVVSTSASKPPVVSTSTSKQSVVSTSTSKQPVVSTSTSKQPVKSSSKVTTCSPLLPKVTTCSPLLPKVTTCSPLLPKVTTCSPLLPKVTTCSTLLPKVTTCSTLIPEHRTLRPCTSLQTTSVSEHSTLGPENGAMIVNSVAESNTVVPSVFCVPEACFAVQQSGEEAVQNIMMCQYLPSGPWAFGTFHSPLLSFQDLCRQQTVNVNEVDMASISHPVRAHSSEQQRPTPATVNRHQLSGFQAGGNTDKA